MQNTCSGVIVSVLGKTFGKNLRELRLRAEFTHAKQLAAKLGVKPPQVTRWERDRTGPPGAKTLILLAKTLDCSVNELLDGVYGYTSDLIPQAADQHSGASPSGGPADASVETRLLERLDGEIRDEEEAIREMQKLANEILAIATSRAESLAAARKETTRRGGRRRTS